MSESDFISTTIMNGDDIFSTTIF